MDKLKVCIVGCGAVTEGHLKAWKKIPNAKVTSVIDLNERLAKKTAETWKVQKYFQSLTDALSKDDMNIVDIATPPQIHAAQAVEAMEHGKHVIIEKPMTMTSQDAKKILDCYRRTGVKAIVLHNWLFDQPTLTAKSIIKEGRIGRVFDIEVEAMQTKDDPMAADQRHWVHRLHGGRFSEMLAHPIYLIREFLGEQMQIQNIFTSKIGEYPWMKSDELTATFSANGRIGRCYASFNSPQEMININIYGEKGIINVDLYNFTLRLRHQRKAARFEKGIDPLIQANQLVKCTAANSFKIACNRWITGHDSIIRFFSDYFAQAGNPPVSIENGYEVVKLTEEVCKTIVDQEQMRSS